MTTNKPINLLDMNDDILQLIQDKIIIERKLINTKRQKMMVVDSVEIFYINFEFAMRNRDAGDDKSEFYEWFFSYLNDSDNDDY